MTASSQMYGDVHVFHLKYANTTLCIKNKIKDQGPTLEPCALAHGIQLAFAQRSLHGSKRAVGAHVGNTIPGFHVLACGTWTGYSGLASTHSLGSGTKLLGKGWTLFHFGAALGEKQRQGWVFCMHLTACPYPRLTGDLLSDKRRTLYLPGFTGKTV